VRRDDENGLLDVRGGHLVARARTEEPLEVDVAQGDEEQRGEAACFRVDVTQASKYTDRFLVTFRRFRRFRQFPRKWIRAKYAFLHFLCKFVLITSKNPLK